MTTNGKQKKPLPFRSMTRENNRSSDFTPSNPKNSWWPKIWMLPGMLRIVLPGILRMAIPGMSGGMTINYQPVQNGNGRPDLGQNLAKNGSDNGPIYVDSVEQESPKTDIAGLDPKVGSIGPSDAGDNDEKDSRVYANSGKSSIGNGKKDFDPYANDDFNVDNNGQIGFNFPNTLTVENDQIEAGTTPPKRKLYLNLMNFCNSQKGATIIGVGGLVGFAVLFYICSQVTAPKAEVKTTSKIAAKPVNKDEYIKQLEKKLQQQGQQLAIKDDYIAALNEFGPIPKGYKIGVNPDDISPPSAGKLASVDKLLDAVINQPDAKDGKRIWSEMVYLFGIGNGVVDLNANPPQTDAQIAAAVESVPHSTKAWCNMFVTVAYYLSQAKNNLSVTQNERLLAKAEHAQRLLATIAQNTDFFVTAVPNSGPGKRPVAGMSPEGTGSLLRQSRLDPKNIMPTATFSSAPPITLLRLPRLPVLPLDMSAGMSISTKFMARLKKSPPVQKLGSVKGLQFYAIKAVRSNFFVPETPSITMSPPRTAATLLVAPRTILALPPTTSTDALPSATTATATATAVISNDNTTFNTSAAEIPLPTGTGNQNIYDNNNRNARTSRAAPVPTN